MADSRQLPPDEVRYFDLEPADDSGSVARACPTCRVGRLALARDPRTMVIREVDRCVRCGRQVCYLDIEQLRARDWAGFGELP